MGDFSRSLLTPVKRVALFLSVNLLVVATISILLGIIGLRPYLMARGVDYRALLLFFLVWGMSGAVISLLLSKAIARWTMGVKLIDPATIDPRLARILKTVAHYAENAGLGRAPDVGIYASPEVNAFATGPSRGFALVAISSGLFQRLAPDEVDGVIAHEIAHIANGDMVTMTLVQGVVNAFVLFLAQALACFFTVRGSLDREENRGSGAGLHYLLVNVIEAVLLFFGMILVAAFSRRREYRADTGGAAIAGRSRMLATLRALHRSCRPADPRPRTTAVQTLRIANPLGSSRILRLFATHPTLESRIIRIERLPRE